MDTADISITDGIIKNTLEDESVLAETMLKESYDEVDALEMITQGIKVLSKLKTELTPKALQLLQKLTQVTAELTKEI